MAVQLSPSYREVRDSGTLLSWENSSEFFSGPNYHAGHWHLKEKLKSTEPWRLFCLLQPASCLDPSRLLYGRGWQTAEMNKASLSPGEKVQCVNLYSLNRFPTWSHFWAFQFILCLFYIKSNDKKKKKHSQKNPTTLKKKNRPVSLKKKTEGSLQSY